MRSSLLLAAVATFTACLAAPAAHNFVLHEKRGGSPHQWTKRNRAHPEEILPVRIGLVQSNLHKAEEYILDVSDPSSPNFGKCSYMIFEECGLILFQESIGQLRRSQILLRRRGRQ